MRPNFGLHCEWKKSASRKQELVMQKLPKKFCVWDTHVRKDNLITSSEMSLHTPVIYKMISFSDGFFWWPVAVKSFRLPITATTSTFIQGNLREL